jgi:hypothetical protein
MILLISGSALRISDVHIFPHIEIHLTGTPIVITDLSSMIIFWSCNLLASVDIWSLCPWTLQLRAADRLIHVREHKTRTANYQKNL